MGRSPVHQPCQYYTEVVGKWQLASRMHPAPGYCRPLHLPCQWHTEAMGKLQGRKRQAVHGSCVSVHQGSRKGAR